MTRRFLFPLIIAPLFLIAIGMAVIAQEATPTPTPTPTPTLTPKPKILDPACMKAAVEKRENAIQAAFETSYTSIKSALETRESKLLAAWDITNNRERKVAIRNAWDEFKKAKISAARAFKQAKNAAWDQYGTDRRACGFPSQGEWRGFDLSF